MFTEKEKEIYKAILKIDGIREPFDNFGPNNPKIGDFVRPDMYYRDNFTYKLENVGSGNLTKEEVMSTPWNCIGIRYAGYHMYMKFKSVYKINGLRRTMTYTDPFNFTAEIVDMPEKAKLIIKYKNGEFTLLELLKIFKEKKYDSRIMFKSILCDISGDDYLEVMTELLNENNENDSNLNSCETLGARLRNLLTPYATLLSVVKLLKTVEEDGDNEKAALIKEKLYNNAFDNLQQLIDFSETEEMEKNIWIK